MKLAHKLSLGFITILLSLISSFVVFQSISKDFGKEIDDIYNKVEIIKNNNNLLIYGQTSQSRLNNQFLLNIFSLNNVKNIKEINKYKKNIKEELKFFHQHLNMIVVMIR